MENQKRTVKNKMIMIHIIRKEQEHTNRIAESKDAQKIKELGEKKKRQLLEFRDAHEKKDRNKNYKNNLSRTWSKEEYSSR